MATRELTKRSLREVVKELKSVGTSQNRKVYARHGVSGAMFGVSFAEQKRIAKTIKVDHPLALGLWETENHDARILATMIVDSALLKSKELDAWVKSLDNYVIADAFVKVVASHPLARKKAELWRKRARHEWVARVGWMLVASLATQNEPDDRAWLASLLPVIENDIHGSKNRIKDAMNYVLISMGGTHEKLTKPALKAADRIGLVEVDHGETGCKTRPARDYIESMLARKSVKKASSQPGGKKSAKKKATKKKAAKKSAAR